MNMITRRFLLQSAAAAAAYSAQGSRAARAENAPGVTDTEIKIGQTMPYSGPASAYGVIGRTELAYFKMINDQGCVNGRKINLISLDDAYTPSNTVEQTRRLVEQERVAFIFGSLGGYTNLAVRKYLNDNKIPHLSLAVAADIVGDPEHYPWTIGANPAISSEVHIYAKYILATKPNAKIGVLYQHDGVFKIFVTAMREGLGAGNASMIVGEASYELSEPTVDSQIISLQGSGADTLIIGATPKAAAQAIRKAYDLGWSPDRFLFNGASGIATTLKPAGLEKSKGIITAAYGKDPNDPRWKDNPGMKQWEAFAAKYLSATDFKDSSAFYGFNVALLMIQVLKQCGDDLSRDNIMRQALNIKNFVTPGALPGASINTSPTNYFPIRHFHLTRFNGENWELFGELMTD
jgi:ABC-type branched-subunit amino acid transport system substrate-binding protein